MPEIEVLSMQTVHIRNPKGEMEPRTLISYRTENGAFDSIVVEIADPTDKQIVEAIRGRQKEQAKFKPHKIEV